MTFTPRPVNLQMTRFLAEGGERSNLHAGMGSGKTVSTLNYLDGLYNLCGESRPTLIIGPRRVVTSTWPDEIARWPHLRGLEISVAVGTPQERAAALSKDVALHAINYDNLQWLVEHLGDAWPYGTVISDESTRLKSFRLRQGGKRAQALGRVAHKKVRRWHNLTGTPAPNGLIDLWGQQWFIDQGRRLGLSFSAFEARWFAFKRHPGATKAYMGERFALPGALEEISERLADCTLTITNALGVDEPVVNQIDVTLPSKAMSLYKKMHREMFVEIEGIGVEAFNAAGKVMKCLQIASGFAYNDAKEWAEVHDAKLQALDSVISEANGMPVLVAYHFIPDLQRLLKTFPKGRHLDEDPQTIRDWNAGKIPILFAHPQSAGHGLNLQFGSNILCFYSCWWDLETHNQIIERVGPTRQKQAGFNRPVFVHYLVAKGTVDENVVHRLRTKSTLQDELQRIMKEKQQ